MCEAAPAALPSVAAATTSVERGAGASPWLLPATSIAENIEEGTLRRRGLPEADSCEGRCEPHARWEP